MRRTALFFVFLLACCSVGRVVNAEMLPAWQVGLGGGLLNMPDYRGSNRSQTYPYPFIMPIFRGERLQADEDGIRGMLFDSERIKFDISLDGSAPVKSHDNAAREGMPDLDPTFQVGPMLRIKLWERENSGPYQALSLNLPVRAAFSIGSGIDSVGWTAFPHLTYRYVAPLFKKTWRLGLSGGLLWGDETFHDYYYQVSDEFVSDERASYNANAGYGGARLIATLSHIGRDAFVSFYALYDRVDDASFADSPLVKQKDGFSIGFVVTWFLFNADQQVEVTHSRW
jgi:outer membrane scaffolding protein for murein synthesis (MipA/OmpV family)